MRICFPLAARFLWLFTVFDGSARVMILTSFAPVHCFASNVAGDVADVSVLVPPNAGPHDYSFSPADIQKIAKADVLVINGAGLENWLQRGIRSAGRKDLLVVDTSAGIHLITGLDVRPLAGSGGEFQRILIAYALLDNPDLLLLDEPMTGLDVRGGMSFDGLLHHLNEHAGITIVMVSHDLHLVEHLSDQVLCINRTVHCHGSPDQVLQPDNLSKAYGHLPGLVCGHGFEAFIPLGKLK
jgi:translation initiation factor RLI1